MRRAAVGARSGRRRPRRRPSGSESRSCSRSGSSRASISSAPTVVVCAYGLLIPEALLEQGLWLNVHPSLLPRWRGAAPVERAILAGDTETGVTIHRTVKELDAGPVADRRAFPIGPEDDAGARLREGGRGRRRAPRRRSRDRARVRPAGERRCDVRGQDHSRGSRARPLATWGRARRGACGRSRRTSARGPILQGKPVTVWRARVGEDGAFEPVDRAAGRRPSNGIRRMAARAPVIAPARRAAFDVLLRVFEDGAYADRALRGAVGGLDERDRALARQLAFGTVQRARTLDHAIEDAREASSPAARPPGARRAATRRLPARVPRRRPALCGGQRVCRARSAGSARTRGAVHERSPATRSPTGARALVESLPEATRGRGGAAALVPRLDRRDLVAGSRRRDGALALMRAQNEPAETAVRLVRGEIDGHAGRRDPRRLGGRSGGRGGARRRAHLAAEPRLPARRARRRRARRRTRARSLRRTRWQGDDARRGRRGGRSQRGSRARARGERPPARAPRACTSFTPTAATCRPS